ncbi:unnamed protein product [Euphydryas editha]|uniref:TIMELESS-interacting protein n=1 Tax=Euphydryas editha TaxID=104508 RepID=A0AAU9UG32_EUPED|nr:unnamed protein product [Euphydryas editha]
MSLLEDVFLQDEANEAQELERIIEGDEFEERPRSDSDENSEKEDEAEEDKRRVDPTTTKTRRVIKNPRFVLNPARLTGPRGIQVIPDHFKNFKFKGKGHERDDLDLVLKKLEHWAYRLYPKFKFEDCLKKIETLGKKRPVMVHLTKIRSDQYLTEETVVQMDSSDEEAPQDEFDKLLQQQIELARSTPAPNSVKKVLNSPIKENRSLLMPKATSSPSISEEQRERMLRNRKLAEERRLARLKNQSNIDNPQSREELPTTNNVSNNDKFDNINENENTNENNAEITIVRHNRSNIIDSSDEDEAVMVNESIKVDVHNILQNKDTSNDKIKERSANNAKDNNYDNDKEINEEMEILQNDKNLDKSNENFKESVTNNAKDDNYDNDKECNEEMEILQNDKNIDKSNENFKESVTNNSKDDNYDNDKESNEEIEILPNDKNLDKSNGNFKESLINSAKDDKYDSYKENNEEMDILQNNINHDKLIDCIEKTLATKNKDVTHDPDKINYDKAEVTKYNSCNDENKLIEKEISGAEAVESNTQELNIVNKIEMTDRLNSTNQNTDKNQIDNVENIEDLMDVDFSDDF